MRAHGIAMAEEITYFERDIPCSDEKIPCSGEPESGCKTLGLQNELGAGIAKMAEK